MNNLTKVMLVVFLMTTSVFYAQRKPDREKIKSLKVAFITERLDLSSKEAEAFWPVYNAHEGEIDALRQRERIEIRAKLRNAAELTEAEADKLLPLAIKLQGDKAKSNLDYLKKINKIISSKKTILLMKAEEDFNRQLIKQYRHNKSGGGGDR